MSDPVTRKTHKYDPNNFTVPEFKKNKEGKLDPTDYQAALALKDFMQKNDVLFINGDHHWEANNKGTVTFGDKVVQLNDKEQAMFKKLSDGLFDRLDAGANLTHDGVVGGDDIVKAIKKHTWILHGDKTSADGHWKDPAESISMTKQQAKERIEKSYKGSGVTLYLLDLLINEHKGTVRQHIDDPALIHAALIFRKELEDIMRLMKGAEYRHLQKLKVSTVGEMV